MRILERVLGHFGYVDSRTIPIVGRVMRHRSGNCPSVTVVYVDDVSVQYRICGSSVIKSKSRTNFMAGYVAVD